MMQKIILIMTICFGATLFILGPGIYSLDAQESEVQRLQRKVIDLENRIKDLEAICALRSEKDRITGISEQGWVNTKNWRTLKIGMTQTQVESLLGVPIKAIDGVRTLWYYPNIYCGYVSFDEKGLLVGWNEP